MNRLMLVMLLAFAAGAWAADGDRCADHARQIVDRFETEVVAGLSAAQRADANRIVLDVCQSREAQVDEEVQEAVQQAREEEQEKAESWWNRSTDKAGNKRLKRKQH